MKRTALRQTALGGTALVAALALLLSACGGNGGNGDNGSASAKASANGVTVTGAMGEEPTIKIDTPLELDKSSSFVTIKGDGAEVESGKSYIMQLTLADGRNGKTVISTYDKGRQPLGGTAGQGSVFPVLENAVVGEKVGSRVVVEATADDTYGKQGNSQLGIAAGDPVVMVADIVATAPKDVLDKPKGTPEKPEAGAPKLQTKNGVPTGFDFSGATKPKKTTVYTLIRGNGPKVGRTSVVTVNYLGQVWGSDKVFDASYPRKQTATFPIGVGSVIPGWDKGLVGVPVGSRVLVICPPEDAYGAQGSPGQIPKNATLAFVVDVLGVSR